MAEEQNSHLGLWALLALLVGGGIFAATKAFGATKVKTPTTPKGGTKTTGTTTTTSNGTPSNGGVLENDATNVGYPYSIDIKKIYKNPKSILNSLLYDYNDYKGIVTEKRVDGYYLGGGSLGEVGKWYVYNLKDGSFIREYTNVKDAGNNTYIQAFTGFK